MQLAASALCGGDGVIWVGKLILGWLFFDAVILWVCVSPFCWVVVYYSSMLIQTRV
jgi:hypothetical protein